MTLATLGATIALLLSVVTLWTSRWLWIVTVSGVLLLGFIAGVMHGPAAIWLAAMALSASALRASEGWIRVLCIAATAAVGLLLGLHVLPGFSNPIVLRDVVLASDAQPYSQYINFDKTLGAVLFLGCAGWMPTRRATDWRAALQGAVPVICVTVIVVMAASLTLGYVRFDPRRPMLFEVWAPINLSTTCVSEEAFFRGLIQHELLARLSRGARSRQATSIAVIASAALFGLAHIAGGWQYVLLAGLAGCGYGIAYVRTTRLEMAMLTHFAVNAIHFLLFTYPGLA